MDHGPRGEGEVAIEQVEATEENHSTKSLVRALYRTFGKKAPHAPVELQPGLFGLQ